MQVGADCFLAGLCASIVCCIVKHTSEATGRAHSHDEIAELRVVHKIGSHSGYLKYRRLSHKCLAQGPADACFHV